MPTRVVFGDGALQDAGQLITEILGSRRPALVTDKGIVDSGILKPLLSQTGNIPVFDGIEANPRSTSVDQIGTAIRGLQNDLIIAVGGGSAIDAGKAVALLATNPGSIETYEGRERYQNPPLPLLAIPTTCGTGSEVTWVAVITHPERKFKMSIKGPHMFPVAAIVDPDLLTSLPPALIAATGMDALTHAIEAYTARPASPLTDLFALRAIRLTAGSIRDATGDIRKNTPARSDIMLGSTLAGFAFGNSDVGAVHCISESIGALFDIPHGVANAVFLPHVMSFNAPACMDRYAEIAGLFGISSGNPARRTEALIAHIKALSADLGIPSFSSLNIDESRFPQIAESAYRNNSNPSNPRPAESRDYLAILAAAAGDG